MSEESMHLQEMLRSEEKAEDIKDAEDIKLAKEKKGANDIMDAKDIKDVEIEDAKDVIEEIEETEETVEDKVAAGVHNYSAEEEYVMPDDPKVLQKLQWFQDQKLALMMHWGAYSQLGLVESWALSDADAEWSRGGVDWEITGEEFKKEYFNLNKPLIRFALNRRNGQIWRKEQVSGI